MFRQPGFRVSRCNQVIEIEREEAVSGGEQNPIEIRCFEIQYVGTTKREIRFSVKAGLFIYNSYPYHVRLLEPIPIQTNGNHTNVQRLTRLRSNRMGIHWKEENDSAMIELSQSRLRPDGEWSNTYCANLEEIYRGARITNNGQIEDFYNRVNAQLGKRGDLLFDESPNSPRQHYQCCFFQMEGNASADKVIMYSYLLARLRPLFYGYTIEDRFI
jgi:hypothetical protein